MTAAPSADLLRVLGSVASPGRDISPPAADGPSFDALLAKARSGALETGLPVSVASGSGVELSAEQLERLSAIVDRAHAAGATRVVVMMDGLALDIDVLSRRVLGEADLRDDRVLTGIDGLVNVASRTEDLPKPLPLPGGHPGSFARRSAGFPG